MRMSEQDPLTVTQLNRLARDLLEQSIGRVWIRGELIACSVPSSGHWYFTLKDELSQVPCALFKHKAPQARIAVGTEVLVSGHVSLYEPRGQYQMVVESITIWGQGQRQLLFDALKQKLADEGLLALERKRPLPRFPRVIGIISSEQAAGLQDVLVVLKRRYPLARVRLYPSLVQGSEAPRQLLRALARAHVDHGCLDVLMIVRGGGSPEDLWCFNDEAFVRAVADFPVPTLAGIGHEIDMTLVDWVVDYRAPTPSAAAEAVVPDQKDLCVHLGHLVSRLKRDQSRRFERYWLSLDRARAIIHKPLLTVQQHRRALESLRRRLDGLWVQHRERLAHRLSRLMWRLKNRPMPPLLARYEAARHHFFLLPTHWIVQHRRRWKALNQRLWARDPEALFKSGWAWASQDQKPVVSLHDLVEGAHIELWLPGGYAELAVVRRHFLKAEVRRDADP